MEKIEQKTAQKADYTGEIPNTPLRFIWYTAKPHKWWLIFAFLAMVIAQLLEVVALFLVSRFVDDFTTLANKSEQLEVFYFWGTLFLVVIVIERLSWRISGLLGIKYLVDAHATGYKKLYKYVVSHSHTYFSDRFAGSVSNKVSNAVDGASQLTERLMWGMIPQVVAVVSIIFVFFTVNLNLGFAILLALLLTFIFNIYFVKKRRPYVVAFSAMSSKVRGEGVDLLTNIGAVRQYSSRHHELNRINGAIEERARKDKKQWFLGDYLMVANTLIGILLTIVLLAMTYSLLEQSLVTVGTVVLIFGLLGRLGFAFTHIGNMLNNFVRFYGQSEEGLSEILVDHEITDATNAKALQAAGGKIAWNDVTFEFGANAVFDDFNLTIEPGQRIGLVGPSGAGKTTFVSLLLRQHDITAGAIEIDGQNIATITQDSLRENIAVVPQEPMLFHRSIRENIAYGKPDATDEEIIEVAKKAQAHDFIVALETGYDTLVGERGIKLSGGQKQRVAIARAMLKDAPILVLDEATSALDSESEVAIQAALHVLMEGKTVIAVAHRLSTLREMDRILVLEAGKIVEDGSHTQLSKSGGTYQRLWEHQAGGFVGE